jgi:hypothetical protein
MLTVKRLLIVGALLTVTAVGAAACGGGTTAKTATPSVTTQPATSTPADETFPDEGVTETTKPDIAGGKIGQVVELSNSDGPAADVAAVKVKFSQGDEFNKPERGQWLGVYIKTKALADGQTSLWGDIYVTMRGHHYNGDACCPDGFKPSLDYNDLNAGETSEGWLIFDVPARHGTIVLADPSDNSKIATWTF